ncbi:phage tail protein [Paraburkholderia sp. FT54]|uniref:phage tail protein n=1 Tax=Paraburkholderia sp. FT54 TaxID=3074437 RepID=UPI002877AA55|nr:phage tail protein [Paraburkholderia sp. FT54]WNC90946.1 phage tail protein [Paraburkholderia sp. FT54]
MLKLDVRADVKGITASLSRYVGEQQKAVVRALNKTAMQARTAAAQEVRGAGYNIKSSAIKNSFSITKAAQGRLVVVLKSTGRPVALINYGARQGKNGVSVQVKAGRTVLRHAFIATMPNGHRGVFERTGKQHKKVKRNGKTIRSGLPIKELFGPSIPQSLANDAVEKALMTKIRQKFPQILKHELAFIAAKR